MLAKSILNASKRLLKLTFINQDGPTDTLLVNRLRAAEHVSRDFEYEAEILSDNPEIAFKDVQGKLIAIELLRQDGSTRYFTGHCWEFALQSYDNSVATYRLKLVPWLAFLRLRRDMFIFQNQTYIEQTKEIFLDYGGMARFDIKVRESGHRHTYCAQYNEDDYNYVHRRWEEMGWHYWYEHSDSGHRLILSDYSPGAAPVDGDTTIAYHHDGGHNKEDKIAQFGGVREVVSGKVTLASFDFKKPTPSVATHTSQHIQGDIHKIEIYDYRGHYGFTNAGQGKQFAERQMEQIEGDAKCFRGQGDNRQLQPGRWFKLARDHIGQMFSSAGKTFDFLVISVLHEVDNNLLNSEGGEAKYSNSFECLRKNIRWRPEPGLNSEDVRVPGIDTAIVVGPAGEEIYTDKYGRIKVQFHWDRMGKHDEKSSAWVRVMTPWANKNFGMVAHPRIGTEVVIQYLQGNPDRPVVIGQLYNERHMPPWSLPANQTQSGILTRSSKGGSASHANALRFEDKKGEEEVWLHAEKDQRIEVENDESHWVGRDRRKTIDRDETVHVKRDRSETVDRDETITVHNNRKERVDHNENISIGDNRTEDVGKNESIDIGKNRSKTIGQNEKDKIGKNWSINVGKFKTETIGMAYMQNVGMGRMENVGLAYNLNVGTMMVTMVGINQSTIVGKQFTLNVGGESTIQMDGESISLSTGKSSIVLNKNGEITISGDKITIAGGDSINAISPNINNN